MIIRSRQNNCGSIVKKQQRNLSVEFLQDNGSDYNRYLACPDCDLLMPKFRPVKGHKTVCPRCGCILLRHCHETFSRSFALSLTGLLLFFPATLMPLLTFKQLGLQESGNILLTAYEFLKKDYYLVAFIVFIATILFPLVKLTLLAFVSLCLRLKKYPQPLGKLFRVYTLLEEWAMSEVYLLGIMITIIKMYDSAEIVYDVGFFCFVGMVIITLASSLTVCKESYWSEIEGRGKNFFQLLPTQGSPMENQKYANAADHNILLCRVCGKLSSGLILRGGKKMRCPRCDARLHFRKPGSVTRTWALICTAVVFLFPANFLPIMHVEFLGIPSSSTILDGIKLFFQDGSFIIAIIILTASILIPIFKIVGLAIVLLTIQLNRPYLLKQKAIMFRTIEFIGRWSMLDIFVVAILGYFINFGFFTSIETAPAATYFCLVVISTMIAANSFDPRIMWDLQLSPSKKPLTRQQPEE